MDSDEKITITDSNDAAWIISQRNTVVQYLTSQKVTHAGVSSEPRWFLSPYIAIWAVRSKANPDRIGWWAVSGDVPTDYISCGQERDDADVLLSFARQWKAAAKQMAAGIPLANYSIGPPGQEKELAPMLQSRAKLLEDFARDMKNERSSGEG